MDNKELVIRFLWKDMSITITTLSWNVWRRTT